MNKETHQENSKSTDDKLGFTIRFLRAAQEVRLPSMESCTVQYPFLATLADYRDPNLRNSGKLEAVRSHAMELARSSVTEGLRELGSNFQGADIDAIGRK